MIAFKQDDLIEPLEHLAQDENDQIAAALVAQVAIVGQDLRPMVDTLLVAGDEVPGDDEALNPVPHGRQQHQQQV